MNYDKPWPTKGYFSNDSIEPIRESQQILSISANGRLVTMCKRKNNRVRIAVFLMVLFLGCFLTDWIYKNLYLPAIADPPVRVAFCNFDQYFVVGSKRFGRVIIYDENFQQLYQIDGLKGKAGSYTILPSNRLPLLVIWNHTSDPALLFLRPGNYDLVHLEDAEILSLHDDFDTGLTRLIVKDDSGSRSSIEIKQTLSDLSDLPIENDDLDTNPPIYSYKFNDNVFKCSDKILLSTGSLWETMPLVKTGYKVERQKFEDDSISLFTMIKSNDEERFVNLEPAISAQGGHLAVGYEKVAFLPWKNDRIYAWNVNSDEFRFEPPNSNLNWNYFPKFRIY